MIERCNDWRQRQGDIRSVGGDMMALVAGSPKNGKGDIIVNSLQPYLMLPLTMLILYYTSASLLFRCMCCIHNRKNQWGIMPIALKGMN